MQRKASVRVRKGFALPTVLIASVVLLTILAVSITATSAVRTALKDQYYAQLAKVAGEAGVAYAKACLAANGNVPQWTDDKPLKPGTDCAGNNMVTTKVQYLVVAGGGGGGNNHGGGGGAGGVLQSENDLIAGSYPITVGGGGVGGSGSAGAAGVNGGNSSIAGNITAVGGGGGGGRINTNSVSQAKTGGSGGGGAGTIDGATGQPGAGKAGTVDQGNNGGNGSSDATAGHGGGGGGAAGVGGNGSGAASAGTSGPGGAGIISTITGVTSYYAGGGSGGRWGVSQVGAPGAGGGAGGSTDGVAGGAGSPNTGGGGGGGGGGSANGGAGGSGIVILSYPTSSGVTASGGTVTTAGGRTIHTFTSSGSFTVSTLGSADCATDPRCYVTMKDNIRTSFSVPRPTLDSEGKAVTIANNGYTEIIRTSTGSVWRTYTQPSVQAAVVPGLCFGSTSSALGWANVVQSSTQDNYAPASSAQTITHSNANLNAGYLYFRKDFNVTQSGRYDVGLLTPAVQDQAELYIDGSLVMKSNGSLSSTAMNLSPGCHSALVRVTNATFAPRAVRFTASIQRQGSTVPVTVTDSSWRVSTGAVVHYSSPDYYANPSDWVPARYWTGLNWAENLAARGITSNHGASPTGITYFRDNRVITVTTPTEIKVGFACTYTCVLFLDGEAIGSGSSSTVTEVVRTLQPGSHRFGMRQQNSGGVGYFYMSAFRKSDNVVLTQSDLSWSASTALTPTPEEYYSYEQSYVPSASSLPQGTVKVLVVGAGGGGGSNMGGGGGGGGVLYDSAYKVAAPMNVTVGAGGNGAPAGVNQSYGANGGASTFGSLVALGGGGGGSEYNNNNSPPGTGSSGGGTASCNQTNPSGATLGQGFKGGSGGSCYYPGGGGGAGGVGVVNPGHGGPGVQNDILGPAYYWGGGGGGSGYTGIGGNGGIGGGGGGAVGTTTGGAGYNNGSPGGGGATVAQVNRPGGNGGANTGGGGGGGSHYNTNNQGGNGGSGIVVVSYPTGSLSATGGQIITSGGNTIHIFKTNDVFMLAPKVAKVDSLVIGGGGGGGGAGSGGGAGGYVYTTDAAIVPGVYPVTVGNGGAGGVGAIYGQKGFDSSFNGVVAEGGGFGVSHGGGTGGSGGSGGGGAIMSGGINGSPGVGRQGNNGGLGALQGSWYGSSGGGGGAGTAGAPGSDSPGAGAGGAGLANNISGISVFYAGGGGAGEINGNYVGAGGNGGGGSGVLNSAGTNGVPNTGGGGGGGSYNGGYANGGGGGSGIVIIRYLTGSLSAIGGTMTISGPYTVHTFTTGGYFTVVSVN